MIVLPTRQALNYFWNFGSLLGIILIIQVGTGLILALIFSCRTDSFNIINWIIREDLFLFRWLHLNGASVFFLIIYLHILRGIIFSSYRLYKVWLTGVIIYVVSVATAFIGYVLPWGQISFWAATVITGLFSVLPYGTNIVIYILRGFYVNQLTLTSFYALHFLLPLLIIVIVIFHLQYLHETGSSSKLIISYRRKVYFDQYFSHKDLINIIFLLLFGIIVLKRPYLSADHENFIEANPIISPLEIKPEWYFLWLYAVLRSIPNKVGGVVIIVLTLISLPLISIAKKMKRSFSVFLGFIIVYIFIWLSWIGGNPVEDPFLAVGQFGVVVYFRIVTIILLIYSSSLIKV